MSAALSIEEIVTIGLPIGNRDGWLFMLQVYFDDSGTHGNGSPFVVVGGLLGTTSQWEKFDPEWRALLREPLPGKPPLQKWHSWDCRFGRGEFEGYTQGERDHVTHLFRSIIIGSGVSSLSAAIDARAWRSLVAGDYLKHMGSAEQHCLVMCIDSALGYASQVHDRRRVAIYYDLGRRSARLEQMGDNYLHRTALTYPRIFSLSFLRVAETMPLQGADMVATETFWAAQEWIEDRKTEGFRAHFQRFIEQVKGAGFILDEGAIKADLARRNSDGSLKDSTVSWSGVQSA